MSLINKILWLAIVFEYVFSFLLKCSLSNANYFMLAKKCWHEKCIIDFDFTSAKMEFALQNVFFQIFS